MISKNSCQNGIGKYSSLKYWLISFLFIIPPILLYLVHFFKNGDNLIPTGFIIEDMFYYMANAREHFDNGYFQLTYGNPFSPFYDTPPIYFQPMTLILGIIWKITQFDPGIVFCIFGFVAALICSRIAIALYNEVVGLKLWFKRLGLILFFYGGGILALFGILSTIINKNGDDLTLFNVFRFDPFAGWWFLNFGRNLIFPTESLYHALFLGSILCLLRKKYTYSLIICLTLSMSHPFTGIEHILILFSWGFVETIFLQNKSIPKYFLPTCLIILACHLGYYLGYLRLFEEHRQLISQWSLPWVIKAKNIIPAYLLVGSMTIWQIRRYHLAAEFFSQSKNRLFMVWFFVAFILSNHEFLIDPIQPLHFTRGYIWIPLFLMGSKSIFDLFILIQKRINKPLTVVCTLMVMIIFLADNGLWIGYHFINSLSHKKQFGIYIEESRKQVLTWIDKNAIPTGVVISQDLLLGYCITCYTPLRAWYSHKFNTPLAQLRKNELAAFFREGQFLKIWRSMDLLVIYLRDTAEWMIKNDQSWPINKKGIIVYSNSNYVVVRIKPNPEVDR